MMKCMLFLCAAMLPAMVFAKSSDQLRTDPYTVKPQTVDWQCGINTSQIVQGQLKEIGLVDPAKVDDKRTEIRMLLKRAFGGGRYEQVYAMTLHETGGRSVSVIAESTAEADECPASGVKTFVVSHELGEWPSLDWVLPPKK